MMKTSNPAFRTGTFGDLTNQVVQAAQERETKTMTVEGAALKTGILLILVAASAAFTWSIFFRAGEAGAQAVMPWMIGGLIGGLIVAMVTIFKQTWSPYTAPLYAVLEGLGLGGLSAFFELQYPGIPMLAVGLTFGVMFMMLALYVTRVIKVTGRLIGGIVAATGAIALLYLVSFVLGMFGVNLSFMHGSGLLSIGISVVVVVVAALNLVLDFHMIEEAAEADAPKYMEWYGAFGLLVTLVWLYIELLHLLSKLKSR